MYSLLPSSSPSPSLLIRLLGLFDQKVKNLPKTLLGVMKLLDVTLDHGRAGSGVKLWLRLCLPHLTKTPYWHRQKWGYIIDLGQKSQDFHLVGSFELLDPTGVYIACRITIRSLLDTPSTLPIPNLQ